MSPVSKIDAAVLQEGVILSGKAHPGLCITKDEASLMGSLAVKLRLSPSSHARPESANLKAFYDGPRPWDTPDPAAEFF